jgi:hypothetical protein
METIEEMYILHRNIRTLQYYIQRFIRRLTFKKSIVEMGYIQHDFDAQLDNALRDTMDDVIEPMPFIMF